MSKKIEYPTLSFENDRMYTDWEMEEGGPEEQLLEEFYNSKYFPIIRKCLSYRTAELTESLVDNANSDSVKVDQGGIRELREFIAFLDGCDPSQKTDDDSDSIDTIVE